jgi:hypothetical protein
MGERRSVRAIFANNLGLRNVNVCLSSLGISVSTLGNDVDLILGFFWDCKSLGERNPSEKRRRVRRKEGV